MTGAPSVIDAAWLRRQGLQRLLAVLSAEGELARIAGGAVRDTIVGAEVSDVDIAATTVPEETARRATASGFKTIPTGIEHGTVTVVADGVPYQVTTLRADIETDGRRARVVFGTDWHADANRRDFTINALYAEADGTVIDLVGGLGDLAARTVRFIGDPEQRIREDYLRILRFFRFFAWYGRGRPDSAGLLACARLKEGVGRLSAERVWMELRKLLAAPDPSRALLWMRQSGVLTSVLPESEKWGIDAIHGLVRAETDLAWDADALLRLMAIVPPDPGRLQGLADRLKLSARERERLTDWSMETVPDPALVEGDLARRLYRGRPLGITDRLRLALASSRAAGGAEDGMLLRAGGYARQLAFAEKWLPPAFPVRGSDLTGVGMQPGPDIGKVLKTLEDAWVASGFALGRDALLRHAAALKDG